MVSVGLCFRKQAYSFLNEESHFPVTAFLFSAFGNFCPVADYSLYILPFHGKELD
jgi:hypothetical protein